jgi:hypothetical protein
MDLMGTAAHSGHPDLSERRPAIAALVVADRGLYSGRPAGGFAVNGAALADARSITGF